MTEAVLKTAADAQAYALAGRAKVTLRSSVSGQHYSYKIKQAEEGAFIATSSRFSTRATNGPISGRLPRMGSA